MNTKFYLDTEANDDASYQFAMNFACSLLKKDLSIKKIVLFVHSKRTTLWFERLFGKDIVKKMFNGFNFNDCPVPFKIETVTTFKKSQHINDNDIVICCGLDSEYIFKIDDYSSVKYIIAIPWLKKRTEKWVKTWNAIEILNKNGTQEIFPDPTPIVKVAMQELTNSINLSTGISHHADNEKAKTYIRALHKYEDGLKPDIVGAYLIRELKWEPEHAKEIEKLIDTLNSGKYFIGGEKKGLQDYYKSWEK